jgi:hypothetical protein
MPDKTIDDRQCRIVLAEQLSYLLEQLRTDIPALQRAAAGIKAPEGAEARNVINQYDQTLCYLIGKIEEKLYRVRLGLE